MKNDSLGILGTDVALVRDRGKSAALFSSLFLIFLLYVADAVGHVFMIVSSLTIAGMASHLDTAVKNPTKELFLDIFNNRHEGDSDSLKDEIKKAKIDFDKYFANAIQPTIYEVLIIFFCLAILIYLSLSRLIEHFNFEHQLLNYICNIISSFLFSSLVTGSLLVALLVPRLKDKEEAIRLSNLNDWANIIREHDLDDVLIHQKRVQLDGLRQKANDLTDESVLFSALSFSAFLAMVMADRVRFSDIAITENGFSKFYEVIYVIITGQVRERNLDIFNLLRENSILLISLLLLLCSIFFLCNIISLVRFNDRYHRAESVVRAAELLNQKEESLDQNSYPDKKEYYRSAIIGILESVEIPIIATRIPLAQMKVFRAAGLICFLLCGLVCANLFSTGVLTITFLVVFVGLAIEFADWAFHYIARVMGIGNNGLMRLFDSKEGRS